ncbi:MAG: hypothetical protein GY803_22600 [Chloroflexi bacterium]|nr:hypothetical protein [Chloroflexota bacterium]
MNRPLSAPRIIERPRIRRRLFDALETGHVLLTAPAGFGKSIALRDLARNRPDAHLVALTLVEQDTAVLEARLAPELKAGGLILLDDVHLLAGSAEAVGWLSRQLSQPEPRWGLAGRGAPFDLDWLIAAGQMTHFNKELLAFTEAETAVLLPNRADQLHEQLGGWPLALSLLSRLPPDADPLPAAQAHLFAYLTQSVFAQLPPELKRFMMVTAVPIQFNADLARALWDGESDPAALLAQIRQSNLYIQPANEPDWFRYHDLIRDYLREGFEGRDNAAKTAVSWFQANDDVNTAVEQALDARLTALAAQIISQISLAHFHGRNSYFTYRRWVRKLPDDALAVHPMMLVRLANVVQIMHGYEDEAHDYAQRAVRLATAQGDSKAKLLAQAVLSHWHYQQGQLETGRQLILSTLADPDCSGYPRLFGLRIAAIIISDAGLYEEAPTYYEQAVALAHARGTRNEPRMNQANRALKYLLPLGRLNAAQQELEAVLTHFEGMAGWTSQYLTYWCELEAIKGDWPGLTATVARATTMLEEVESKTLHSQIWLAHYQTILAVAAGNEDAVQSALARYDSMMAHSPLHQACIDWLACWHLRRQGLWTTAVARAKQALTKNTQFAYYRARTALEADIAQGMALLAGESDAFALHAETLSFARWRSRVELTRLRALLAVVCHHQGDSCWRRHWTAVRRTIAQPAYAHLLTRRDPELGAVFWRIGIIEGLAETETATALIEIGQFQSLLPLLEDGDTTCPLEEAGAVRVRAAALLAKIGDERAMGNLTAVLAAKPDKTTKQAIENAIIHLENQPPPPLTIQLMGNFGLQRGGIVIPNDQWHRPIVLRLFQYLALNAGRPLPKDQILDDLWPDADPAKAWTTFRTVYSRLRKVVEPHMRPKAANRYVAVRSETYTFDPDGLAQIDAVQFEQTIRAVLRSRDAETPAPLTPDLLSALQNYAPLLPNLPYADWLLEPRQKLEDLYIEGCLYAAQACLIGGDHAETVVWAKRAIAAAPWLEEAYQALMRGYGRQGQRTLALRVYDEAAANLQQELNLEPSPLTKWLAESLRAGKSI